MTRITTTVALLLAIGGLSGCRSMKIHSDWSPDTDFTRLGSWAWSAHPHKSQGDQVLEADTLFEDRVKRAVERQMATKGYQLVERGSEDFQLSFFLVVEDKVDVTTINNHYGYGYGPGGPGYHTGWGYGPGGFGSQTVVDQYQEGSLVLDVTRSDPLTLIWRGSATARLARETTPEKSEEKVNEAVTKILERFPPEPGSQSH
jgi:hypothetical protein